MTNDSGFGDDGCSLTDKMWKCNICIGYYYKPKLLPCTHSYCFDCIDSLVDIWSPEQKGESPKTSSKDIAFWCPECHKEVSLPTEGIDGFPDNVYVHSTLTCPGKRPVVCQICKKESASFLCKDCKEIYCYSCHNYHNRFSNTRSHVVKELDDYMYIPDTNPPKPIPTPDPVQNRPLPPHPSASHFKCGPRTVHTFCMDSTGRVVMCSRVNKLIFKKIRLTAFNCNGEKLRNKPTDSLSVSMASLLNDIVMVADREKSTLSWTTASTLQLNKYCDISITGPVLSKPVPGRSAYVIGKGPADVYDIARVVFPGELKSVMSLKNIPANPCSFDVSSDEQYFAVVSVQNGLRVAVFNKGQEIPVSTYELKQSSADICFHTSETYDREVLLLAVCEINQTIMLDYLDHCKVLGILRNNRPSRLSKDTADRTLVACNWENSSEAEVISIQM